MRKRLSIGSAFILVAAWAAGASAQQWVNPAFDCHRLDYRDLGYPTQNLIPADNSQITALLAHSNGLIYGATSGKTQAYLFLYNRYINKVRPLGRISDEKGVYHGLLEGADGAIYIGSGLNMLAPVAIRKDVPVYMDAVATELMKDIRAPYAGYAGGHLYRYVPKTGDVKRYRNEDPSPLEDLGIPVAGNTIYAMTWNPDRTKIYGIAYPDAHFFVFDLATRVTRDLGEILEKHVFGGPERHWRSVPRALHCDPRSGRVYTSGENGIIIYYDPKADAIAATPLRLPGEYYEALKSMDYPVVEAFDVDAQGHVYGGTSDGYLFRVDFEKMELIILGKPRVQRRLRAMNVGKDGNLYMITGELEKICKLHTYDLGGKKGFAELGVMAVDRSPYYAKRAYSFDAMAVGPDGAVFLGESDRRGKLFIYTPGPGPFEGLLNPANPVVERMRKDTPALIPEAL